MKTSLSQIFSVGLSALCLVSACQTSGRTASITEAKKISADFEDLSLVPPPRTITDVLDIIHQNQSHAEAQRREWLEIVQSVPPEGAGARQTARFFMRRAAVRSYLGQIKEQLNDLKSAEEAAGGNRGLLAEIYQLMGVAYVHGANYRLGLEFRRRGLSLLDREKDWGSLLNRNATLASFEARLGDFASADKRLAEAKQWEATIPRWDDKRWVGWSRSVIRLSEGDINLSKGHNAAAEVLVRQAIVIIDRDIDSGLDAQGIGFGLAHLLRWELASCYKVLATALLRQGRLAEAEVAARRSVETAVGYFGRVSIMAAEMMPVLTDVLLEQDRAHDAEKIARESVNIYRDMGVGKDSLYFNLARVALAETLAAQGKWPEVLMIYRAIDRDMENERDVFDHAISGNASWAIAEIVIGNPLSTIKRLTPVYARRRRDLGDKHVVTAETGGLLAAATTMAGRAREALPIFDRVVQIFASSSRDSAEEGVTQTARDRRIAFILESYVTALHAEGNQNPDFIDRTLRIAALAQGRSVQRAVLAAAVRNATQDPSLADLVRWEQDAGKRIAALNGTLANMMNTPPARRDTGAEDQVHKQIEQLRVARAALAGEISSLFPDYTTLVNPAPPGLADVHAALSHGEVLIVTYTGQVASYVWAVPKTGEAMFRRIPRSEEQIYEDVRKLRTALDPNAETLADIPPFDVTLAHKMYRDFFQPVKLVWEQSETLLVVADGPLGQLPMSLLVTEPTLPPLDTRVLFDGYTNVPWLVRDHAISVLPSVTALTVLRSSSPGRPGRRPFAGFGNPLFVASAGDVKRIDDTAVSSEAVKPAGHSDVSVNLRSLARLSDVQSAQLSTLPPLPDTADEIKSIAVALHADITREVFLGPEANEQRVKEMDLSDYSVIAFATHGLVPGDLDGLTQPALALSSPAAAGVRGDGLLTMEEILSLRLDADWVVLSACNTGAARGAGAEAVSGLGRAFFYAGARSLLVSNWPVETTSARELTTAIFRRQAENRQFTHAESLRAATLSLLGGPGFIDPVSKAVVFSYAHPIFWAPFTLIGDAGGARAGP